MPHCVLDCFPSPSDFPQVPAHASKTSHVHSHLHLRSAPGRTDHNIPQCSFTHSLSVIKIGFFFFLRNDLYLLPPFNCSFRYLSPPRQFPKEWGPTLTHADAPRCRLSPVCAVTAPARGSLFIRRTHPVNRKTS